MGNTRSHRNLPDDIRFLQPFELLVLCSHKSGTYIRGIQKWRSNCVIFDKEFKPRSKRALVVLRWRLALANPQSINASKTSKMSLVALHLFAILQGRGYFMKIGFHSNQLNSRGTEGALFDHAIFNQEILRHESIIFYPERNAENEDSVLRKFSPCFKVLFYESYSQTNLLFEREKIDAFYLLKAGEKTINLCRHVRMSSMPYFRTFRNIGTAKGVNSN